jgi:catechol 2,3-dioxygenase-like lactoylglutathione lyase family enzyme
MQIRRLLHAAVLVSDLDRARRFYEGVLGLRQKKRHDFDFAGAWYELGEGELHLMVAAGNLPSAAERPRRDNHIAFQIDDLDEARRMLETAGLDYRESSSGLPSIFVRDPDGNLVELQQRVELGPRLEA